MLKNERIKLRAVEPEDVDYLFETENDTALWYVSETLIPFSRNTLKKYAESVHDFVAQGQFRFIIVSVENNKPIGMIDLFDYDVNNQRAGVGVVITDELNRNKGYAFEGLSLLKEYCKSVLNLKQLYCSMHVTNKSSQALFEKIGFEKIGERKSWYKTSEGWEDDVLYQLILT